MRLLSGLMVVVLAFTGALTGCKKTQSLDDVMEKYVILDVQASPEWLQTHSVVLEWQGKKLPLPAVFKLGKGCLHGYMKEVDPPTLAFLIHQDRENKELSAFLHVQPDCKLNWSVQLEDIVPDGGKATTSTSGTNYQPPEGIKLQDVTIHQLWIEGSRRQRPIPEIQQMLTGQVTVVDASP